MTTTFTSCITLPTLALASSLGMPVAAAQISDTTSQDQTTADDQTQNVSTGLSYTAPSECPDEQEYSKRLTERSSGAQFVENNASRTLLVEVVKKGESFEGTFRTRGGQETSAKRRVVSTNCEEVVDALAVVGALSFSPAQENGSEATTAAPAERVAETIGEETPEKVWKPAKSKESKKQRHQRVGKELRKGHTISMDIQAGATMGRTPEDVGARFDLALRTALLLSASHNEQFLYGFVPRIRANIQPLMRIYYDGYETHLTGAGFAAGGCYTPYFEPDGFKVFACADFGADHLTVDPSSTPNSPDYLPDPEQPSPARFVPRYWTGTASFSIESEFKVVSFVHGALRAGVQQELGKPHVIMTDGQEELMTLSNTTFIATAGLGAHF